jgi:hypothetical protein
MEVLAFCDDVDSGFQPKSFNGKAVWVFIHQHESSSLLSEVFDSLAPVFSASNDDIHFRH